MLEKTLESPLDCKEIHQSILKKISPEYSLEGLMLKLQYFGYLMRRADSFEKTLILGMIEGKRRRGQQREHQDEHLISSFRTFNKQLPDQPRQHTKKQRYYFADKGPSSQTYDFSNSHV